MDSLRPAIHRAKYLLVEPGVLLENAAVRVSAAGRITAVEPWDPARRGRVQDWGPALIMPGLVNAHTHLELTSAAARISPGAGFTGWLLQVIERRREMSERDRVESTREGARLALLSGTTLIGDISSGGPAAGVLHAIAARRVVFFETLALAPERAATAWRKTRSMLERALAAGLLSPGVSPHAPYSVSPGLYRLAAGFALSRRLRLCTHAAETRAEAEFLARGTGEFTPFLERLGSLPPGWEAPALGPIAYLDRLGVLGGRTLLIHCNYLSTEDVARIRRRRCSVVFCPRSHARFGHRHHPVRRLLDAGVNVALGTDSLASNDSLSMLDEMRYLFRCRKDLNASEIVRMATVGGAAALGQGRLCGRLGQGFSADMTVLEFPGKVSPRRVEAALLEGAGAWAATVVQGRVFRRK